MTRKTNIKYEHIRDDLEAILFDGNTLRTVDGYTPPKEARRYLITVAYDAYIAGLHRLETELNKEADREVAKAQKKAIDQILKMKY